MFGQRPSKLLSIRSKVVALDFDTAAALRLFVFDGEMSQLEAAAMRGEETTLEELRMINKANSPIKISGDVEEW